MMEEKKKLRVLLWCGNAANQKALANKIAQQYVLVGVVIESKIRSKKTSLAEKVISIINKFRFSKIDKAWFAMLNHYNSIYKTWPQTKIELTTNINSESIIDFSNDCNADVILVSGTSLISKKLLQLKPRLGIINLHTGVSPYVKGGPNCTNWCIANNLFHLIGNTIMWIDEGIDSGNIIASELTEFSGNEDLNLIHLKVMEHAHQLYLKVLKLLEMDAQQLPNENQNDITAGSVYYSKQWNGKMKKQLLQNLKNDNWRMTIASESYKLARQKLKLVELIL